MPWLRISRAPHDGETAISGDRDEDCTAHFADRPIDLASEEVRMKRRILLVDDDLAVLLTLKAVLELNGFEVETASSSAEAFARMESGVYHMVISDLRMETEEAGLEVIRTARRQTYDPATALLTAYPPSREWEQKTGDGKHAHEKPGSNCSSSSHSKPTGRLDRATFRFVADQTARNRRSSASGGSPSRAPCRQATSLPQLSRQCAKRPLTRRM